MRLIADIIATKPALARLELLLLDHAEHIAWSTVRRPREGRPSHRVVAELDPSTRLADLRQVRDEVRRLGLQCGINRAGDIVVHAPDAAAPRPSRIGGSIIYWGFPIARRAAA